jgi:hypothetical protein
MDGPTSKKTKKEPPKRANHKGNIKFPTYTRADPTPTQAFASSQVRGGKGKIFTSCSSVGLNPKTLVVPHRGPIIEPSHLRAYYVLFWG